MTRKAKIIREVRSDLSDYVIHFTRRRCYDASHPKLLERPKMRGAFQVLMEILDDGVILPTFAAFAKSATTRCQSDNRWPA